MDFMKGYSYIRCTDTGFKESITNHGPFEKLRLRTTMAPFDKLRLRPFDVG